jgi:FlaA1/EpsC-like NDP-sugar epimerase
VYLYKFHVNHDSIEVSSSKTKVKTKDRFNCFDRLLHIWGLENLPILFNVLRGDLSLVGPPPEKSEYIRFYSKEERDVFSVRPGLWWPYKAKDISGNENTRSWKIHYKQDVLPEKIKSELEYVKDTGVGCDIRLLLSFLRSFVYKIIYERFIKDAETHNYFLPLDMMLIFLSYLIAYFLRFEWQIPQHESLTFFKSVGFILLIRIITFYAFGIYKNLWKYVGLKDLVTVIMACTISTIVIIAVLYLIGIVSHSRSIFFIDWILCISLIGGSRLSFRLFSENSKTDSKYRRNILIIGAGAVAAMALSMLQLDCDNNYHVIGFVDNEYAIRGKTIHGVKVLGTYEDIPELVSIFRIDEVLIAVSELSSEEMKIILKYCKEVNVRHRLVPAVNDLFSGATHLSKFREVEIADLFGRQQVKLDLSAISTLLKNRQVLVTGAGGSIGSELCRHIAEFNPKYIILVDKNENYLHEIRCELESQFEKLPIHCSLCSITNREKLRKVFLTHRPEMVFHAAANKHVPLSDENPEEAVWNNIFGTKVLAKTADEFGVQQFVMISTDKAVNPTSVMGATKRIAEFYIQALSAKSSTKFVTVRFGNVLNSNGSVIPIFRKQIERGGPITITHPDVERYFMSISEAVQLILQTITIGKNGEIFVLDMGKSIRIMDMAMDLISQAGLKPFEDIAVKFIGLRPGEKMYEELVAINEEWVATSHSSIKILKSSNHKNLEHMENKLKDLINIETLNDYAHLVKKLKDIVPEFTPCSNHYKDPINGNNDRKEIIFKMPMEKNKSLITSHT